MIVWVTAFALMFQTTIGFAASNRGAGLPEAAGLSAICYAIDQHDPADPQDRIAANHFQCIACVIAHSLAPPPLSAVSALQFGFVDSPQTWPLSESTSRAVAPSSHSARGPPAAA